MMMFDRLCSLSEWALGCGDRACVMDRLLGGSIVYLVITFIYSVVFAAPYGKFTTTNYQITVPAKFGWCLQEVPAFIVSATALVQLWTEERTRLALALLPFAAHYCNRSFIFPLSVKQGRPIPLLTVVLAFLFCSMNGLMQSLFILSNRFLFDNSITAYFGAVLFCSGMFINIQSDSILTNLRKPGETGYKIPCGGFFEYVSAPNYLGEILEWLGWFLVAPTPASLWFFIFSASFLGTRALHTHSFYKTKFKDEYPASRTAIIPGVL